MEKIEGAIVAETEIIDSEGTTIDDTIERVDFDNPMTILNYGAKLLEEMNTIMLSISKMVNEEERLEDSTITEKIRSLGEFSTSIEKIDKKTTDEGILKLFSSIINKITTGKKKGKAAPTYQAEYENYCAKIDDIANILVKQKNSTLVDIEISNAFINKFLPYIEKLELLIKTGIRDRDEFVKMVVEPLKIEAESSNDPFVTKQYSIANQKLTLFEDKLRRLQETLNLDKNAIIESQVRQNPDMHLVMMYDDYIKNTIPALKIQASSIIGTKRQERRITHQQQLVQVTNEAFKKNSEQIKNNITAVNKLANDGNITIETLNELNKNIGEAIKLVEDGVTQRAEARQKNMELLKEINSSFDEYQKRVNDFIARDIIGIEQLIEGTANQEMESMGSYTKKENK